MKKLKDYFNLELNGSLLSNLLKECGINNILNKPLNDSKNDKLLKSFLKSKNLSENDKNVIELYNDKKITKDMLIIYIARKNRTYFRGKIHLILLLLSPIWIFYMLQLSKTSKIKMYSLVSILCIIFNFLASSLLHNFEWKPKYFFFIEKLDHFCIFFMISGSSFPVQALLFSKMKLFVFLFVQSVLVLLGFYFIFYSCFSSGNRFIRSLIFILAGLLHCLFIKDYFDLLYTIEFILLILLAVFYIVGAIAYSMKKPNILPRFIDFHDLFHIFCLGSAICTFYLNSSVIKRSA